MRTSLRLAVSIYAAFLVGCNTPHPQASFEPPAIVIDQAPDYPMPGRASEFPGGLVAALWRDGHLVRSASPKAVGKSYIEGIVPPQQRDAFFSFLSTGTNRAPKIDGIPLHIATQSITIRNSGTSAWTRILPDSKSVWHEVELRLFQLPLQGGRAVNSEVAESLIRER